MDMMAYVNFGDPLSPAMKVAEKVLPALPADQAAWAAWRPVVGSAIWGSTMLVVLGIISSVKLYNSEIIRISWSAVGSYATLIASGTAKATEGRMNLPGWTPWQAVLWPLGISLGTGSLAWWYAAYG